MGILGINATTTVNLTQIEDLINITTPTDFFISVNHDVYGGWLYFVLLLITWIILVFIFTMSKTDISGDQILNNLMYAGAIVTLLSFLLRTIYMTRMGVVLGLVTDSQTWIFPIITVILAVAVWMTKE